MKIKKNIRLKPIPKMICLGLAVLFCGLTEGSNDLKQIMIYTCIALIFAVLPCITLERIVPYTNNAENEFHYE